MWPTRMSIHCVCDRAGAPRDPSRGVRDDRNSVHLYTSGRFAELRSNGISVSFVNFLPDGLAHAPCESGSARLWIYASTIQIPKRGKPSFGITRQSNWRNSAWQRTTAAQQTSSVRPDMFRSRRAFSSPSSTAISPGRCHDQSSPVLKFTARSRT